MNDVELKRRLQLLKGSNGEYVLSTITDVYALIDLFNEIGNESRVKENLYWVGYYLDSERAEVHHQRIAQLTRKSVVI